MYDPDLELLDDLDNNQLDTLVKIITKKGEWTETLTTRQNYKLYHPYHIFYVPEIKRELALMGGNTIANLIRCDGVAYREILMDCCEKLDVPFKKKYSTEHIERCLLGKVLAEAWGKMSAEEKSTLLKELKKASKSYGKQAGAATLIGIFNAGGFASYELAVIIANGIAKSVFGKGLTLAGNAALTKALGVVTGPIGMALTGLWTAISFAGPAYRVTIPATVYIASMRYLAQAEN